MVTTLSLMERKRKEAADELVRTAMALYSRDGFEATTVEAIAAAAGCSPRTFYRYFGTKEDVVFHDVPMVIGRLREALVEHLAEPVSLWTAVSEALVDVMGRLGADDEELSVQRMDLWLREPALHARYIEHVTSAERAIVDVMCRHRGTRPDRDQLAQVMAIAAIGAYRTTVTTHVPARAKERTKQLSSELREVLATLGAGLEGAG